MTGRPPAPEAQPGWHWEPEPALGEWRTVPPHRVKDWPRRCSSAHCTWPRIAELKRYRKTARGLSVAWYGYCAVHFPVCGKWIEDGQVMGWRLTRDREVPS